MSWRLALTTVLLAIVAAGTASSGTGSQDEAACKAGVAAITK